MKTTQEMINCIAEKICGWRKREIDGEFHFWTDKDGCCAENSPHERDWNPLCHIDDAMEAVDSLEERGFIVEMTSEIFNSRRQYWCRINKVINAKENEFYFIVERCTDSRCEAICVALCSEVLLKELKNEEKQ